MKKSYASVVALAGLVLVAVARGEARQGPWSREKANAWYEAQPWMRGCNYLPASAANYADMWQELGSEARFEEMEAEFALAEKTGFNVMRLILHEQGFGIWYADHDGFMARFEKWLQMLAKHKMRAIVVLANDCSRPKELWKLPTPGKQPLDWGYHGGRKVSQHGSLPDAVGYTVLDNSDYREKFFGMCEEIVTKCRDDDRIAFWNVWNEPGANNRGDLTLKDMQELFGRLWKIDPKQPLAADVWTGDWGMGEGHGLPNFCKNPSPMRQRLLRVMALAGRLSDIVSYHSYESYEFQVKLIHDLKRFYGRPVICTEWLARSRQCNVHDLYPLYFIEKVGAVNWGLVAGNYQTYEPWEYMWVEIERGGGRNYDVTKWLHDLFRPSHRPYDPSEINLIRKFNAYADEDFAGR